MSDNSLMTIKQVKELNSSFQVNQHLKEGWKLLAVTAWTIKHDSEHEEAQTTYILGSAEEPTEVETPHKYGTLSQQLEEKTTEAIGFKTIPRKPNTARGMK